MLGDFEGHVKPMRRCQKRGKSGRSIGHAIQRRKACRTSCGGTRKAKRSQPRNNSEELQATTGVGCDGFHPEVLLDFSKETRREAVKFLEQVEPCGKCPQQACTTMFFLIPKNGTSERALALLPTLIR